MRPLSSEDHPHLEGCVQNVLTSILDERHDTLDSTMPEMRTVADQLRTESGLAELDTATELPVMVCRRSSSANRVRRCSRLMHAD
jgi:hypothetical protein